MNFEKKTGMCLSVTLSRNCSNVSTRVYKIAASAKDRKNLKITISHESLHGFLGNDTTMFLVRPATKILQTVLLHCKKT